jgi:hypothetical protein
MLLSQPFMFCPECQAEYVHHVRLFPDCGVPLAEHLPVKHRDSGPAAVSVVKVFNELAPIIAIPFVAIGNALLIGLNLGTNPWIFQIVSPIPHTYSVFLFVFCDTGRRGGKDLKGYSLREKAVKEKLPLLFYVHAAFLSVMFAVETSVLLLRPHLSRFLAWEMGRSEPFLDFFDLIVLLTVVAIAGTQITISRRILGRALKRKSDDS